MLAKNRKYIKKKKKFNSAVNIQDSVNLQEYIKCECNKNHELFKAHKGFFQVK